MKFFIATISLLIGIMLGAATTAFLVVKKNPMIRENLCKDFSESVSALQINPLSGLIDSSFLKENLSNVIKSQNFNNASSTLSNTAIPSANSLVQSDEAQKNIPSIGPGGCKTEDDCMTFCSKLENLKECLDFAKTYIGENKNAIPQ
ncbi:MAG: hypothetical protein V1770_06830 [bacterium]